MIPTLIARFAMVTSLSFFTFSLAVIWLTGMFGMSEVFWDFFEVVPDAALPPFWMLVFGVIASAGTLVALGTAYWSIEKILRGGQSQDFLELSLHLKRTALGLMFFWLGYNILFGGMPVLLTMHLSAKQRPELDWAPLDIDLILLIVGIALFAISHVLHRAWTVEEENKQFL